MQPKMFRVYIERSHMKPNKISKFDELIMNGMRKIYSEIISYSKFTKLEAYRRR